MAINTRIVVPGALVVVAVAQAMCSLPGTLTPWKGGGFAMFAVRDSLENRILTVHGFVGDQMYRVSVTGSDTAGPLSAPNVSRTRAYPTRSRLNAVGAAALRDRYTRGPADGRRGGSLVRMSHATLQSPRDATGRAAPWPTPSDEGRAIALDQVMVVVLRLEYEPTRGTVTLREVVPPVIVRAE